MISLLGTYASMLLVVFSHKSSEATVYKAPPEIVYRKLGSSVIFSWCVPSTRSGFKPIVNFYLKGPEKQTFDKETTIAKINRDDPAEILPSGSLLHLVFTKSQIHVVVTNCQVTGIVEQLNNYSLMISNISKHQNGTYGMVANYGFESAGDGNESRLEIIEISKIPSITCLSGKLTHNRLTLEEGSKLECTCSATGGNPPAKVFWESSGGSPKLIKEKALRNDSGSHTCIASNIAGNQTTKLVVEVEYIDLKCVISVIDEVVHIDVHADGNKNVTCRPVPCNTITDVSKMENFTITASVSKNVNRTCSFVALRDDSLSVKCPDGTVLKYNVSQFSIQLNGTTGNTTGLIESLAKKYVKREWLSHKNTVGNMVEQLRKELCSGEPNMGYHFVAPRFTLFAAFLLTIKLIW